MAKYKRGPVIEDMETLIFCLDHRDLFFHGSAILPSCQVKNWTYNKMKERIVGVLEMGGKREMKVTIDGKEISTAAVLWLINYGRTILELSDGDFQLFQLAAKYNMTEDERKLLFERRVEPCRQSVRIAAKSRKTKEPETSVIPVATG